MTPSNGDLNALRDAYTTLRAWYQQNIDTTIPVGDANRQATSAFVGALPSSSQLSEVEIVAVFREAIAGRLEWAYGAEGGVRIVDLARAALETLGRSYSLTPEEEGQLESSVLWPFIKR